MAHVAPTGQFVQVTLLDVPEYLTNSQVEKFMSYYGRIVNIKREHFEYKGNKIENETRYAYCFQNSFIRTDPKFRLN